MKGDLRCVDGRLMRNDPQPDDPYLQTDRGICPDCNGVGCETPKARDVSRLLGFISVILVSFTKPLTDDEMRDFQDYVREWTP